MMRGQTHRRRSMREDRTDAPARACDWPGCESKGEFRAPKARDRLNEYYWFCLEHVRSYNASWNYYSGMTEEEVEADLRRDTVWQRPTWRMGGAGPSVRAKGPRVHDGFAFFDEDEAESEAAPRHRPGQSPEEEAMAVLDLQPPLDAPKIKTRYKELVKRCHPDVTGGDKEAEERFKRISAAYRKLMESFG